MNSGRQQETTELAVCQNSVRTQEEDASAYSRPDVPDNVHVYTVPTCHSIDEITNYSDGDYLSCEIRDIQLWS